MGKEEGMAVGLAAGLTVGLLVVMLLFKKHILDFTFDERQERARGVAFKYGFFALMFAIILYGMLDMVLGRWCDAMAGATLCLCVGITVFAITCILKDAYLSLKESPRYVMTLFAVLSVVNIVLGSIHILDGDMVENGILTFRCTNLVVGLMTTVVLAVYIVNFLLSRRGQEEE
nr:hypothetical protein [uncultured Oscillibacter sp.]